MSITIDKLATELAADPQFIVAAARQMITSGDEKVLTVGASTTDDTLPMACLTDQAAAVIRTQLRTV